jgi:murein DD-endopeptidase MepM/ murein hydrolase activator NlpD
MLIIRIFLAAALMIVSVACTKTEIPPTETPVNPVSVADSFAFPISKKEFVTQAKDSDDWYNALDFGEENHLGEDWNKNTGGNSDCGEPVYSTANGVITYAGDAGPGWGNVVIVTHLLADGKKVQSLYGHLQEIKKTSGEVKKRELIGKIGNANGYYLCHLHFEIREESCPSWDMVFVGYSPIRYGWVDPSDFIDSPSKPPVPNSSQSVSR